MKISEEKINELKAQYGQLTLVEIKTGENSTTEYILVPPSRKVMDIVGTYGIQKNVTGANKALIANCVVAGDMDLLEKDGSIYSTLLGDIRDLFAIRERKVKKL